MAREFAIGILMLVFCGVLYGGVMTIDVGEARMMPEYLVYILVLLSIFHFIEAYFRYRKQPFFSETGKVSSEERLRRVKMTASVIITFISMVLFLCCLTRIGFYTTCYLYMVLFPPLLVASERTVRATVKRCVAGFVFIGGLYILFSKYMVMQTPEGILF